MSAMKLFGKTIGLPPETVEAAGIREPVKEISSTPNPNREDGDDHESPQVRNETSQKTQMPPAIQKRVAGLDKTTLKKPDAILPLLSIVDKTVRSWEMGGDDCSTGSSDSCSKDEVGWKCMKNDLPRNGYCVDVDVGVGSCFKAFRSQTKVEQANEKTNIQETSTAIQVALSMRYHEFRVNYKTYLQKRGNRPH